MLHKAYVAVPMKQRRHVPHKPGLNVAYIRRVLVIPARYDVEQGLICTFDKDKYYVSLPMTVLAKRCIMPLPPAYYTYSFIA